MVAPSEKGVGLKVITQGTPNPNALKFITAKDFKTQGKADFYHPAECLHIPLATNILGIFGVAAIHLFENVLTVTQDGTADWPVLESEIIEAIKSYMPSHNPDFEVYQAPSQEGWTDERRRLEEILDQEIRPGLQADGGDLEVVDYQGNILTVRYEGACGSCPSASAGTLQGIESILRHQFNPELQIALV